MASVSGKRTSSSRKTGAKTGSRKTTTKSRRRGSDKSELDMEVIREIKLIILFLIMLIVFCCNLGVIGPVGDVISGFLFGIFGFTAYVAPPLLFAGAIFWYANEKNPAALRKLIAGFVLFLMLGVVSDMIVKGAVSLEQYDIKTIYERSRNGRSGGGVVAGSLAYMLHHYLETLGTILVVLLCSIISLILLTERTILRNMKEGGRLIREHSRMDPPNRAEAAVERRRDQEGQRARKEEERVRKEEERRRREEERRLKAEEKENERILRMERKVSGVMKDTTLRKSQEEKRRDDIHEIVYQEQTQETGQLEIQEIRAAAVQETVKAPEFDFDKIRIRTAHQVTLQETEQEPLAPEAIPVMASVAEEPYREETLLEPQAEKIRIHREDVQEIQPKPRPRAAAPERPGADTQIHKEIIGNDKKPAKKYMFPPLSRLQKGQAVTGDSTRELKETAQRLQQTLSTFGVKVTITDISQGPSVTRYELQPEQGVKVSKIVNLADDIKLNLAATDIRIEAPIPGKAAIGIEVPNKENMMVALRDLLESREFKEFPSSIAFAVGKDIGGKTVVTDIAKMPHMLIAGSTGSGKSVCINTLIMSILYKAHPEDVKLIMVDPKVVELSVYNGIPHLLIPVVTDPKKAAAALHWGVSEMEDRYRKFAEFNVRDLKGYNKKVESMREGGDETAPARMPQIIIIVDELADLMMVSPGEVEESICRLAQLARAAGIHLIIATQRPSVDVITGLIKANMPSRVAFAVSSGVDSRTILDMNGAEKLLGKGDMLFYPQGYSKPVRIQGAFVSDKEVSDVVDFLKNQMIGNTYAEDIEEKIQSIGVSGGAANGGDSERDDYFAEAGRFIIDKDKASIGMLQRVLKIGFNRAARIMDQLCEYGVVGEEEGTKPRKVLMSLEQFEQLLEEI